MSPEDVVKVLFEARKQNMYDGRYAFISIDFDAWNDWNNAPQWIQRYPRDIFTGLLDVSIKGLDEMGGSQYTTYVNDLQLKLLNAPYHYQAKQVGKLHFPQLSVTCSRVPSPGIDPWILLVDSQR